MEDIKPKKERKFLKAVGKVAGILLQEFVLGLGRKFIGKKIDRIGNKRQALLIFLALFCNIAFASVDSIPYPITGNKQRLGWQTSGNGLVWRGLSADTITKPTSYADKNVKAYLILDSVRGTIFVWRQTYWDSLLVGGGGGGAFTQPVDSLFFNTSVPTNNVDTAKMRWDYDLGTVVLGMYDQVPNELGFKNFWLVKNQTGSTITKGSIVYANGTVGASGRITVAKFIANGTIEAKYLLGVTAHDLTNGEDGYVISFGKIRQVNTDTFAAGAILYPSPTVAGVWTDVEPIAPNIDMPIGFCINSSANNGTIAIRVASGYKLSELHDVAITSPVDKASLYYSGGLWRDTTATLLVSDTAAMLANYSLKGYVDSIAQNFQDSIDEITNGYFKQEFPTVTKDTLNWTKPVQLPVGGSNLLLVYRNGQMINDAQYSVIDTNKVKINSGSYKLGENYTVVYVKGGGGSGNGGVPFDTSVLNLQARLDLKLNISDTAAMLANYATKAYADTTGRLYARQDYTTGVTSSTLTWTQSDTLIPGGVNVVQVYRNGQILLPSQYTIPTSTSVVIAASSFKVNDNYTIIFPRGGGAGSSGGSGSLTSISAGTGITVSPNPITTTGTVSADLSVLMELNDTVSLSNRINLKLNATDTASLSNRINAKLNISDTLSMLSPYFRDADTTSLNLTSRFALKLNATDTASLSNRINAKGSGTVTSVATGYGLSGGTITSTGTLVLDSAVVFSRIRDSIVEVAIGNDTIKILKQEYAPATSSVLTWTVTPKFPIQLKAYILVFRNGQLLINDQYNLTDTNKITIVSNSFKLNSNYTVVTVSGIGSVGSAQAGNPVYPEEGIALSTGSTWASSIPNNSTNWNTAYTDRLKWDGGSSGLVAATGRTSLGGTTIGQSMFTLTNPSALSFPQFNADNTVTALSASSFRGAIGAGTVSSVTASSTAGNPLSITNTTTTPIIELLSATSGRNGYLTSTDWTTFNNKQSQINGTGFVKASGTTISYDNSSYLRTGLADSTYLKLTGGTLTGDLYAKYLNTFAKTTYVPFNAGIGEQSIFNVGTALRGGTVMVFPDSNLVGSSANIFLANSNVQAVEYSAFGSGIRNYSKQAGDSRRNSLAFYTSGIGSQNTNRLFIDYDGNVGINDDTPSYKLEVNGTLNATGATTLGSTLAVTGATTLSTTTATPTVLLGKDGSNVVGAITLGSGLTLSSGTLTASGATGVTSVTATSPLLSSGGSTPNITITDASTTTSGVITTGTQSIAGAKTFTSATVINGGLVVNEDGSSVGTFRVEGDNNTSLIQTSPASDYVGIGRVPENSFDVQGAVRFRTLTLNGTPTRIIGADATGDINQITLGTGLSLSSGTLSATNTGTVTNVTGTLPISVANGTTTPSITIANASTSASGVVTTGTQSFAGAKTFTNIVGFQRAIQRPVETITVSSASITTSNTWVIVNNAGTCTLTLPSAGSSTGTEFFIKTITNNTVVSASSNIVPLAGGSAGTAILSASAGKWATLVSDGTNWIIMQAN